MTLIFAKQQNPSYDPRVAFIQMVLGYSAANVDGKFGSMTEASVKRYQRSKHIPDDGRVDERTGRTLELPYWDGQILRTLDPPFRDSDVFNVGGQQDNDLSIS